MKVRFYNEVYKIQVTFSVMEYLNGCRVNSCVPSLFTEGALCMKSYHLYSIHNLTFRDLLVFTRV